MPFDSELILRVAQDRVVPIVMMTLATALAVLPLLTMGDVAGMELVRPMAIVMLGGLLAAVLLNLFVLPALYLRYGAGRASAASGAALESASAAAD